MAWTQPPRTYTAGELVDDSILNQHVRDQLLTTWHLIARKTSDQSVTSSTTLTDCTGLSQAVAANEVWQFQLYLRFVGGAGDFKMSWSIPTAGAVEWTQHGFLSEAAGAQDLADSAALTATDGATTSWYGESGTERIQMIPVMYTGGANAGTLQMRFAQFVSNVTASTIKANSCLYGIKLA